MQGSFGWMNPILGALVGEAGQASTLIKPRLRRARRWVARVAFWWRLSRPGPVGSFRRRESATPGLVWEGHGRALAAPQKQVKLGGRTRLLAYLPEAVLKSNRKLAASYLQGEFWRKQVVLPQTYLRACLTETAIAAPSRRFSLLGANR